jgi:hypothetical protein
MWRAGKLIIGNPVGFFRNIDTRMLPLAPIGATAVHIFFFDVRRDAALALEPEISLNDLPDRSHVAIFLQQPPRPYPLLSIPNR